MIRSSRKFPLALLIVLVAIGCLVGPDYAKPQGQESAPFAGVDSGSTIAVILAISGRPLGVLPIPISSIRAAASTRLDTTLSARGFTVVPQDTLLSMMREWRVRDGKSIPRGFLNGLTDSLDVELLLVANLVVQPDKLIMTARYLIPDSAILLKVTMTELTLTGPPEESFEVKGTEWLAGAREASEIVAGAVLEEPDSTREIMLMLDTKPVGCSAAVALLADHALLEAFAERGDWVFIDPGVVGSALHDAGYAGKYLGADARALLRDTFASRGLAVPTLTSYAPARRSSGRFAEDYEPLEGSEPILKDFAVSLRMVDLPTGTITAGKEVFVAGSDGVGWFGIPRDDTLMIRLKAAADHIWSDIHKVLEEF